jgi:hypothetical protein
VITLSAVTVRTDKTNQVRNLQMGIQRIDVKALKQVPVVFGEADVLRVVLTLPGVKSVGEASTGLNVRGGAADQNLILLMMQRYIILRICLVCSLRSMQKR